MLRFLAVALFFLHLSCGENLGLDLLGGKSRRFTFEDGEYEISVMRTDWYTARNFCKVQGSLLMSLETQAETTAVMQALSEFITESFWTSGSDIDKEGLFYWDTTGAPFDSFTNWGPGKPAYNNLDNCVELNSSMNQMWADANCDIEQFFICEFHPCSERFESENNAAKHIIQTPLLRFTFENSTYEISNETTSWVDAKSACKSRGMELVSTETYEEHLAIMDALVSLPNKSFWTSGSNTGHLGNYYWEGTGHDVGPYTGWAPDQPNDPTNANCILMHALHSHMWNDIRCDREYYYICELQPC